MLLLIRKLGLDRPRLKTLGQTARYNIGIYPMNHTRGAFHGIIPGMVGQLPANMPPTINGGYIPQRGLGLWFDVHILEGDVTGLIGGETAKFREGLDSAGRFALEGWFEVDESLGCMGYGDGSHPRILLRIPRRTRRGITNTARRSGGVCD
jgi:hypothetical protein